MNIFDFNNAIAGAYIKRNETLLDAETGEHIAVSDKFIYETPLVFSSNILNPLISHAEPILFKDTATNLTDALNNLFTTLFTDNVVRVKISVGYGYTLLTNTVEVEEDGNTYTHYEEIVSQVPITFHPAFVWTPGSPAKATFVNELVSTITS